MKFIKMFYALFFALAFLFVSCDKNDEEEDVTNTLSIVQNDTYDLTGSIVSYYGDYYGNSTYVYEVCLMSDSLSLDDSYSLSGSGTLIYFDLVTSDSTSVDGDYELVEEDNTAGSCFAAGIYLGYSTNSYYGYSYSAVYSLTSGTISVEMQNDSTYKVSFDCYSDVTGDNISGSYEGEASYLDYTSSTGLYSVQDGDESKNNFKSSFISASKTN